MQATHPLRGTLVVIKVNKFVDLFRKLACVPQPKSAQIENTSTQTRITVRTQWAQRDLERSENVNFIKNYTLSTGGEKCEVDYRSLSTANSNEIWNRESPSGKWRAIATKFVPKKGDDKYFIEIWDRNHRCKNIDLLAQDKHGKIYEPDVTFGCFEWSPSEKCILYLAEKKLPKAVSYFDTKKLDSKDDPGDTVRGTEHDFKLDWGEQLVGKHKSVLCILNVESGDIRVLDGISEHIFQGQGIWGPSDNDILFTGWNTEPYRLGVVYCPIRDSSIYCFDLQSGNLKKISEDGRSCRSPRFSPDSSKLVYLDNNMGGPHKQCVRIIMYEWSSKVLTKVIDIVNAPTGEEFPGIYALNFPYRCWCTDSKRIVMDTCWRSENVMVVINTETKSVTRVQSEHKGSSGVLDVCGDNVLLLCSAPNMPPYLCIGKLPIEGQESRMKLEYLDGEPVIQDSFTWEIVKHMPTEDRVHPKYGLQQYESIFLCPKTESSTDKPPLVLFPHGGPHSAFTTDYMIYTTGMCLCGFAVLMVNYRGSQGFGEDFIYSLPGNIGDLDVKDVKTAADDLIQSGRVDGNKMAVFGGSHGGFLTTHLVGQYPDMFKAACCRNPVTNIALMIGSTDIPDWSFCETGHDFNHKSLANEKVLIDAWQKSPLQYVDQVKTPVLVMLGSDDLRVPPKQGQEYYKALKARGITTRLISYDGNSHPIIKVDSEADAFVNIMDWFTTYLDITESIVENVKC